MSSRWTEFLEEVRATRISLWTNVESSRLLGVEGNTVRMACTDEFQASMIQKNKDVLADIFQKVFHIRPRLVTEVARDDRERATPSPATVGTEHPVVAALKRELGAEPI